MWFSPKLPITRDERDWVDQGFARLEEMLGRQRLLEARVILPNETDFPDRYDQTPSSGKRLFNRICTYLRVDPELIDLEMFPDKTGELREIVPYWSGGSDGCAGLYFHDPDEESGGQRPRMTISLCDTLLKNPHALVATIAHELGHAILLGGDLMTPEIEDHEPMTDLLTVFLGFGVFNANASAHFSQFTHAGRRGWSMQRLGCLSQPMYSYSLARFASERSEDKPEWQRYLSTNVRAYFKSSLAWLAKNPHQRGSLASCLKSPKVVRPFE
jgi:hypothetical protein